MFISTVCVAQLFWMFIALCSPQRFLNQEPSGSSSAWRPILLLEESSIASLSTVMLLSDDDATEEKMLPSPVIPSGYRVWWVSNYCANGFDRGSWIMAAQGTSLSVSRVESFISSREKVSDEDTPDGRYQVPQGLLESPASPTFSSLGLDLYSTSGNSLLLIHKTGSNGEEAKLSSSLSSSFGPVIYLNSLKLQTVQDVYGPE